MDSNNQQTTRATEQKVGDYVQDAYGRWLKVVSVTPTSIKIKTDPRNRHQRRRDAARGKKGW